MAPNEQRFEVIDQAMDAYKVDGVVEVVLQACHTYAIESTTIKSFVNNKKHKPYISVETDYSTSDLGQLNTRLAAFIEML
jgi:benzoyl-CoA reductase/2-hydroxyglutaryl-CoA dehydratase subunit BcrC/BadD/HgdB